MIPWELCTVLILLTFGAAWTGGCLFTERSFDRLFDRLMNNYRDLRSCMPERDASEDEPPPWASDDQSWRGDSLQDK
jgi:hypothetical protein